MNETESALLDILYKDTVNPLQIKLDGEVFKFGINPLTNSTISLLKNKKEIYIQPLGTGKLYQVKKEKEEGSKKSDESSNDKAEAKTEVKEKKKRTRVSKKTE